MTFVIVLAVLALWVVLAVALAMVTGGVIHERELHDHRPLPAGRVPAPMPVGGRARAR
ncbi:MAG: hypothetical protein QOE37_1886 [Microbacteriaceae bacterium]|nr:hypothetical protein [Microbacteriaceae bacterium]